MSNNQNQPKANENSNVLKSEEYFWGQVIETGRDWVRAEITDGRIARMEGGYSSTYTILKAEAVGHQLVKGDRTLYQAWYMHYDNPGQARLISFGVEVNATVDSVGCSGADLILRGGIEAKLLKAEYATNDDGTLIEPIVGQTLERLIVINTDAHRHCVYVSLRPHFKKLAKLSSAIRFGGLIQVARIRSGKYEGKGDRVELVELSKL